jgi:hypothetical protein
LKAPYESDSSPDSNSKTPKKPRKKKAKAPEGGSLRSKSSSKSRTKKVPDSLVQEEVAELGHAGICVRICQHMRRTSPIMKNILVEKDGKTEFMLENININCSYMYDEFEGEIADTIFENTTSESAHGISE